jgi:hypothetical protein
VTLPATQLLLPDGLAAAAVADALAAQLPIVTQRASRTDRTFWDTFDGRLHAAGLALTSGAGRLVLAVADTSAEIAAGPQPRGAQRLFATDLPAGELRARLAPVVEMRALTPLVRVRSRWLPVNVLDDIGKIVVRLRVEEPAAQAGGAAPVPVAARLHVTGVRGFGRDFGRVRGQLRSLGLVPAERAVQDDAARAAGLADAVPSSYHKLARQRGQRHDPAADAIARGLL